MIDFSLYRQNRDNRLKILNLYRLDKVFAEPPISSDEFDRLLNEQHIKSILREYNVSQ